MLLGLHLLDVAAYGAGLAFSVVVGTLVTTPLLNLFYRGYEEGRTVENWRARVLGLVERALYTSSWVLGLPGFLAIWLALKVAGQWDRWKADWSSKARQIEVKGKRDTARAMYAGYLLGNALSIVYGISGGLIVDKGLESKWNEVALISAAILLSSGLLYWHISTQVGPRAARRRAGRARDE